MSVNEKDSKSVVIASAAKAVVNSKASQRLADAVGGLVQLPTQIFEHLVGPDRIRAIGQAKADVAVVTARAQSEIDRDRAETAEFVRDREIRKTQNRRAIVAEAQKALPPPNEAISDEPLSKDFVHQFFEEFDGISDPEVHKIVGRLLANEISRPGSFPRRTMRVLRDLDSSDFAVFSKLCGLCWNVGQLAPLVYEPNHDICKNRGIDFAKLTEVESLGLISFNSIGYIRQKLPKQFTVGYGNILVQLELTGDQLEVGTTMFELPPVSWTFT